MLNALLLYAKPSLPEDNRILSTSTYSISFQFSLPVDTHPASTHLHISKSHFSFLTRKNERKFHAYLIRQFSSSKNIKTYRAQSAPVCVRIVKWKINATQSKTCRYVVRKQPFEPKTKNSNKIYLRAYRIIGQASLVNMSCSTIWILPAREWTESRIRRKRRRCERKFTFTGIHSTHPLWHHSPHINMMRETFFFIVVSMCVSLWLRLSSACGARRLPIPIICIQSILFCVCFGPSCVACVRRIGGIWAREPMAMGPFRSANYNGWVYTVFIGR